MLVAKSQFQRNTCQKCSIGPVQTQKAAYAEKIVISFRCSLVTANCIRILAIDGHISVNSSKFLIYSEYDWCSRYNPVNNSYHTEKCMHVCCVARRVHSNLTLAKYLFNGFFLSLSSVCPFSCENCALNNIWRHMNFNVQLQIAKYLFVVIVFYRCVHFSRISIFFAWRQSQLFLCVFSCRKKRLSVYRKSPSKNDELHWKPKTNGKRTEGKNNEYSTWIVWIWWVFDYSAAATVIV